MALSWPYRQHAHSPYWGQVNSHTNFCEEDYLVTPYIAELINTLTNLTYLYYAYHGIRANANRKDAVLRNLPYLGISGVGIGSAIFHATMKNYTQWCDDLSMLIATSTVLHRVFTFDKNLRTTILTGIAITALMATFTTWHIRADESTMHSVLFGIMIVIVGTKTRSIISARVPNPVVRQQVQRLATYGAVIFVSGFIIWNIDNAICGRLRRAREQWGMPWGFLLELHGWWHIFTACGAYIFIALVEYLTSEEAGQPLGKRFAWPVGYFIDSQAGVNGVKKGVKHNGVHKAVNGKKSS